MYSVHTKWLVLFLLETYAKVIEEEEEKACRGSSGVNKDWGMISMFVM